MTNAERRYFTMSFRDACHKGFVTSEYALHNATLIINTYKSYCASTDQNRAKDAVESTPTASIHSLAVT